VIPYAEKGDVGNKAPEDMSKCKKVTPGDFVLNSMNFGIGSFGVSNYEGVCSSVYLVLEPQGDLFNVKFLQRVFELSSFQKHAQSLGNGILAHRAAFGWDKLRTVQVPVPPRPEQDTIVDFLDQEIEQIETAVEKQRKLTALLLERRQSLINAAVRFGIKPKDEVINSLDIPWIGSYAKRFTIQRLKHNTYIKARVGWKGLTSDEFQLDSYAYLVTGSDFRGKYVKWEDCYQVDVERYEDDSYIHLKEGDLLVTKDGSIGKLALVSGLDKPACLNSGVFLLRPKSSYTNAYMFWLLSSDIFKEFVQLTSYGSTIQHLYQNVFEDFSFPLPDLEEQQEIVSYLEKQTNQIDKIIEESEELVEVLLVRKVSLVSAALTGQLNLQVKD
jgi:type I restriction enzyme S subunit